MNPVRFGLMRSCEFIMKDAYSFDKDEAGLTKSYNAMFAAYQNIFAEFGLETIVTEADSGAMGGSVSHEFMVPATIGEDTLQYCSADNRHFHQGDCCPQCQGPLQERKMIELGHVFQLGTKYSLAQQGLFLNEQGKRQPYVMGCYGIGVSRVLSAIAEVSSDSRGLIWPKRVTPFAATIVALTPEGLGEAFGLQDILEGLGLAVLVDDRQEAAGVKFNDAYLIGNPYIVIVGKKFSHDGTLEVEIRKTQETRVFKKDSLIQFFKDEFAR